MLTSPLSRAATEATGNGAPYHRVGSKGLLCLGCPRNKIFATTEATSFSYPELETAISLSLSHESSKNLQPFRLNSAVIFSRSDSLATFPAARQSITDGDAAQAPEDTNCFMRVSSTFTLVRTQKPSFSSREPTSVSNESIVSIPRHNA